MRTGTLVFTCLLLDSGASLGTLDTNVISRDMISIPPHAARITAVPSDSSRGGLPATTSRPECSRGSGMALIQQCVIGGAPSPEVCGLWRVNNNPYTRALLGARTRLF